MKVPVTLHNPEQLDALIELAHKRGVQWKKHLRRIWLGGKDQGHLRAVRNLALSQTFWARVTVEDLIHQRELLKAIERARVICEGTKGLSAAVYPETIDAVGGTYVQAWVWVPDLQ